MVFDAVTPDGTCPTDEPVAGESHRVAIITIPAGAWKTVNPENGQLEVAGETGTVRADRAKLLHVFENLFRNAVEHAGDDFTVRVGGNENGWYVADDGPGIPPGERDGVLEYGYSSAQGIGIGLAIVKDVIEAHGWGLGVYESDDGGARFDVRIDE